MRECKLEPYHDFKEEVGNYEIISISIAPNNDICVLILQNKLDYTKKSSGGATFPKTKPEKENDYLAIIFNKNKISKINIKKQKWNYHFIQSLDKKEILLANARSQFFSKDSYELNAKVFDNTGKLIREFWLGDGIQDLKTTKEGMIWTSYFDEGIFGNFGWENPIGASGLRSWDKNGKPKYEYKDPSKKHFIVDCYALNVVSDKEIWFYYYSDFNLVRLKNGELTFWKTDISSSDGFVILGNHVLFRGGYDKRDTYHLYKIEGKELNKVSEIEFKDEKNTKLQADRIDCRGSSLLLQKGTKTYLFDLKESLNKF